MFASIFAHIMTNKYFLIVVFLISMFTGGYIYYLRTSAKISGLENDKKNLQFEVSQLQIQVETFKKDFIQINNIKDSLSKREKQIEENIQKEKDALRRENQKKKSLEELAIRKSSLIEKKINAATQKQFKCFEDISNGKECDK